MKSPRDWDGEHLVERLTRLGFSRVRQSGSHVMVRHEPSGAVISIPAHRPLKIGTLNKLLKLIAELTGSSRDEIIDRLS